MTRLRTFLIPLLSIVFVAIFSFIATAFAAGAVAPDDGSLLDLAKPVLAAVMSGQWVLGAALALVFVVAGARRYLVAHVHFLGTDAGAAVLTLVGAFGGALATALTAGVSVSAGLLWTALGVAAAAAGGYSLVRKLLVDPLCASAWYRERAAPWMRAVVMALAWAFTKPDALARADEAGKAAVQAHPAPGAEGVVGKPEEL
jgi:hypothetical protein